MKRYMTFFILLIASIIAGLACRTAPARPMIGTWDGEGISFVIEDQTTIRDFKIEVKADEDFKCQFFVPSTPINDDGTFKAFIGSDGGQDESMLTFEGRFKKDTEVSGSWTYGVKSRGESGLWVVTYDCRSNTRVSIESGKAPDVTKEKWRARWVGSQ